jgi:hypothetical protein
LRTFHHVAIASASDSIASAANTTRHDANVTIHASGAPAATAPMLPANSVTPFSVAKRFDGNHTALILRIAMNDVATPAPTSVRPAAATCHVGASANASEPIAATSDPAATSLRGPHVSASTPTGICSTI